MYLVHSRRLKSLTALACVLALVFSPVAMAATPLVGAPERADAPPPPWFDVDPNQDGIWGNGWTANDAVDVLIGNLGSIVQHVGTHGRFRQLQHHGQHRLRPGARPGGHRQ